MVPAPRAAGLWCLFPMVAPLPLPLSQPLQREASPIRRSKQPEIEIAWRRGRQWHSRGARGYRPCFRPLCVRVLTRVMERGQSLWCAGKVHTYRWYLRVPLLGASRSVHLTRFPIRPTHNTQDSRRSHLDTLLARTDTDGWTGGCDSNPVKDEGCQTIDREVHSGARPGGLLMHSVVL